MKQILRKTLLTKRKKIINKYLKDQEILNNIKKVINNYKNILIYYPIANEPNIINVINEKQRFYLPYCENKEITIRLIDDINDLIKDEEGIYSSKIKSNNNIDVVIVPAVAVNLKMYRLGYGGGYYDRFLKHNKNIVKIAVVYDEFIIEEDFQDEWDISFDYIITEKQIITKGE